MIIWGSMGARGTCGLVLALLCGACVGGGAGPEEPDAALEQGASGHEGETGRGEQAVRAQDAGAEVDADAPPADAAADAGETPADSGEGAVPAPDAAAGDPCADPDFCDPLTLCMDVDGEPVCSPCPSGYNGSGESGCEDVDECAASSDACSELVECTNEPGGYRCGACPAGYDDPEGDGTRCDDIDECATDNGGCDALTTCENQPGTRACGACPEGFVDMDTSDATHCLWDDARLTGLALVGRAAGISLEPTFDPDTAAYALELPLSADVLDLVATVPAAAAGRLQLAFAGGELGASLTGSVTVQRGMTMVDVKVVAETGAMRTYSLAVTRERRLDAYVKGPNSDPYDHFGRSVALSRDGMTLAVSALDRVYVYRRDSAGWGASTTLEAGVEDAFGSSLALSDDGNFLAVGAPYEDGNGTSPSDDSAANAGAAYVFVRSAGVWQTPLYLKAFNAGAGDQFGTAVALSGDATMLAVGALNEASARIDVSSNPAALLIDDDRPGRGAVYVYRRAGAAWVAEAFVKPSTLPRQGFGYGVALSNDGKVLAVTEISATPTVSLFERSDKWSRVDIEAVELSPLLAQPSITLSGDGSVLVLGELFDPRQGRGVFASPPAPDDTSVIRSGAVHVFERGPNKWSRKAYIKAPNAGEFHEFGASVAISHEGDLLAIGAPGEAGARPGVASAPDDGDLGRPAAGAVYTYRRAGSGWVLAEYVKAPVVDGSDTFGASVQLSADGFVLAAGAPGEDSGSHGVDDATPGPGDNSVSDSGAVIVYH